MKNILYKTLLVLLTSIVTSIAVADEVTVQIICPTGSPAVNGFNNDLQMPQGILVYLADNPGNQVVKNVNMPNGTVRIPDSWVGKKLIIKTVGNEKAGYCAVSNPNSSLSYASDPFTLQLNNNMPIMLKSR